MQNPLKVSILMLLRDKVRYYEVIGKKKIPVQPRIPLLSNQWYWKIIMRRKTLSSRILYAVSTVSNKTAKNIQIGDRLLAIYGRSFSSSTYSISLLDGAIVRCISKATANRLCSREKSK